MWEGGGSGGDRVRDIDREWKQRERMQRCITSLALQPRSFRHSEEAQLLSEGENRSSEVEKHLNLTGSEQ